jgi:glycosyltransferase involved in cell wall biosynthesis
MHVLMVDAAGFSPPYDYALTGALREAGVRVTLVEPPGHAATWADPDALPASDRPAFPRVARAWKGVRHLLRMRALVDAVRRERPDVVHFQWLPLPPVDGWAIRRLRGTVPLVFTMHNTSLFHGAASSRLQGRGVDAIYPLFDRIVVHSDYGRRSALEGGRATDAQLARIPHGAFTHYAALVPPPAGHRDGPFTMLFTGSVKGYKGLDVLLRALPTVRDAVGPQGARLVVAGAPSMPMAPLRQLAQALAVEPMIDWRLRHQTEREIAQALADAHVVVLPYREIDQSGVLLSAVAMERAVVATRVGGIPEVVRDGENGLLVAPEDDRGLADALVRLARTPDLRERFEVAMRERARTDLGWAHAAALTTALYRDLTRR